MTEKTIIDELTSSEDIICEGQLWQNVPGSSERPMPKSGSWKEHWLLYNHAGHDWPATCQVCNCREAAEQGAFIVSTKEGEGLVEYIVPMCKKHCRDYEKCIFDLKTSAALAPAVVDD